MFPTKAGHKIAAYYVKHRHGNAEDIGDVACSLMNRIAKWNANVFLYDYSEAAYDYLTSVLGGILDVECLYIIGVNPHTIVAYGRSIGSGPTVHIALKRSVLGVVLQSPISSVYKVKVYRLPCTIPGDMFRNEDKVDRINVPTLILHGTKDNVVPISISQSMALTMQRVYGRWINGAGHDDMDTTFALYVDQALQEFYDIICPRTTISNIPKDTAT
eukprot:XP_001610498.1 hypothetical protein [Babesia bovis T2Bo]